MGLEDALLSPDSVLFLGAGASWDSGLPLGDEAARAILEESFHTIGASEAWLYLDEEKLPWPRFEVVLEELANVDLNFPLQVVDTFLGIGLSSTHKLLASLNLGPRLWLTTNFDDQIERALLQAKQKYRAVRTRTAIRSLGKVQRLHTVVKLHGDGRVKDSGTSLGARLVNILRRFPSASIKALGVLCGSRPLIFIGYAARDPDLIPLIQTLVKGASEVIWIGKGEAPDSMRRIMELSKRTCYLGEGAPASIERALGWVAPPSELPSRPWRGILRSWLASVDNNSLIQMLADICLLRGSDRALRTIDTLHCLLKDAQPGVLVECLRQKKEVQLRAIPDHKNLNRISAELQRLANSPKSSSLVALKATSILADLFQRKGRGKDAEQLLSEALTRPLVKGSKLIEAQVLNYLGYIQLSLDASSIEKGLENLERALSIAKEIEQPIIELEASINLAYGYSRTGRGSDAETVLQAILPIVQEEGLPRREVAWKLCLAEALRVGKKAEEAIAINKEAVAKATSIGEREFLTTGLNNLGLCYMLVGNVSEAEASFKESLAVVRERGWPGEALGNTFTNRGLLRMLLADWKGALTYLENGARAYENCGALERAGSCWAKLGWCCLCLGETNKAQEVLGRIQSGLIPQTPIARVYYDLLKFALQSSSAAIHSLEIPLNEPGARFSFLTWLLELCSTQRELKHEIDVNVLARQSLEEAEKSTFRLFALSVLNYLLGLMEDEIDRDLLIECRRKAPVNLVELRQALTSAAEF